MFRRLIYKQFVQVSGLWSPQFLSYLPKHVTHHYRALYGDDIFVNRSGTQNQQKHLEITFHIKALSFHSRTSIRAHKHIFSYLKWLCCWKSRGEAFSQLDSIPILSHALWKLGISNCCSLEMKHAMGLETCKKIFFSLSSTICKWEFVKPRYFDFTIWWSHRENHLSIDGYALIAI